MISNEAYKAKKKFKRLGFLISALAFNPKTLSKFKVITQRINFNIVVGKLIKKSVPLDTKFGDAEISQKHCNFFVNKSNATFRDMKNLIDFVKQSVKSKTGIDIETEIELVE